MDIQFISVYDQESLEEGDVYQMVESTAFFEAYRHVLGGLQEIYTGHLPMQVTEDRTFVCFKLGFLHMGIVCWWTALR